MSSTVKPGNQRQNRAFYRRTYLTVVKLTRFDPIRAGAKLQIDMDRVVYGNMDKMGNAAERKVLELKLNALSTRYIKHSKVFFQVLQVYSFLLGKLKGVKYMEDYIRGSEETQEEINEKIREIKTYGALESSEIRRNSNGS